MVLQSCLKYSISIDHILPPEESYIFIEKKTNDLIEYLIRIRSELYPFASIIASYPSKKFSTIMGLDIRPSGKGLSEIDAKNSVLFELAERYSNQETFRLPPKYVNSISKSSFSLQEIYNNFSEEQLKQLNFPAILPYLPLRFESFFDIEGNSTLIPYKFFSILCQGSNGLAAGNTLEEAILHGIYEVVERHCLSIAQDTHTSIEEIDLTTVPNPYLSFFPNIKLYNISFLDIPTILGVLPKNDGTFTCIAGCAGTRTEALNRLLTELVQLTTYANSQLEGGLRFKYYPTTMHQYNSNIILYSLSSNLIPADFSKIDNIAKIDIKDEIFELQKILKKYNMTIYWKNTTGSLGVPSVAVFIWGSKMTILFTKQQTFSYYKEFLMVK